MMRSGKEPEATDDAATQLSWQEVRRLNGVNTQLRPDAAAQRLAASQAAAAKRTANAMPANERRAKKAKHMQEVRDRQRAERAAAAHIGTAPETGSPDQSTAESAAKPSSAESPAIDSAKAEPIAAKYATAEPDASESAVAKPDFTLFNKWLQRAGYAQIEADEWDEFLDDGAFEDATPEDLQSEALIELYLEWRGSDQQRAHQHESMVHEWNCSREALNRDSPPPVFPRAEPLCAEPQPLGW